MGVVRFSWGRSARPSQSDANLSLCVGVWTCQSSARLALWCEPSCCCPRCCSLFRNRRTLTRWRQTRSFESIGESSDHITRSPRAPDLAALTFAFPLFAFPLSLLRRVSNGKRGVVFDELAPQVLGHSAACLLNTERPRARHDRGTIRASSGHHQATFTPTNLACSWRSDSCKASHHGRGHHRCRREASISIPTPITAAPPGAGIVAMKLTNSRWLVVPIWRDPTPTIVRPSGVMALA